MVFLHYQEGCIKGENVIACKDLKIIRDQILENWCRKQGHRLDVGDVADILAGDPEILVVGMGYASFMKVSNSLRSVLKGRNIQLIAKETSEALKDFNRLRSQGNRVAGAFHSIMGRRGCQ